IDVEEDVLVGVFRLQEKQLGDDQIGGDLVDRPDQEYHAFLEQTRVDVVSALAAPALLDDHGNESQVLRLLTKALASRLARLPQYAAHVAAPISASKLIAWSST